MLKITTFYTFTAKYCFFCMKDGCCNRCGYEIGWWWAECMWHCDGSGVRMAVVIHVDGCEGKCGW